MSNDNKNKRSRTESGSEFANQEMSDSILKEILETVKSNKTDLNDLGLKLDNFESRYNDLSIKYEDLEHKYTELNEKYESLICENEDIHMKYIAVNKSIDRINQQTLNSNIEIAGVPELENDQPKQIALCILEKLGFTDESLIKSAYRRRSKNTTAGLPKNIIVSISDKGQRDKNLGVSRKIKNLNTTILEQHYKPEYKSKPSDSQNSTLRSTQGTKNWRPIYLNEHLTDFNKYLLARSKSLRRSGKVQMVYVRNGFVILKLNESSPEIRIESVGQLDGLIAELNK